MASSSLSLSLSPLLLAILAISLGCLQVSTAQFGLSIPCNNCLVTQISTLPGCVGVNLTNITPAQQTSPQYRSCLCDASFDFNWTQPCGSSCQTNEIQNFESNYGSLLKTGLNLTCIKPAPSPTATSSSPSPTHNAAGARLSGEYGGLGLMLAVAIVGMLSTL